MMSNVADIFTLVGLPLTLIGLGFSFWQLMKTKQSALAAQVASDSTSKQIFKILSIIDCSAYKNLAREANDALMNDDIQIAKIRVRDLLSSLNQLISNRVFSDDETLSNELAKHIDNLAHLSSFISQKINEDIPIDMTVAPAILSHIEAMFDRLIGSSKYQKGE